MRGKRAQLGKTLFTLIIVVVLLSILLPIIIRQYRAGFGFFDLFICGLRQDFDEDGASDFREDFLSSFPSLGGNGCPCDPPSGNAAERVAEAVAGGTGKAVTQTGCKTPRGLCDARRLKACATGLPPISSDCSDSSHAVGSKFCAEHYGERCGNNKEGICNNCGQCVSICDFLSNDANKESDEGKKVFAYSNNGKALMDSDFACVCSDKEKNRASSAEYLHLLEDPAGMKLCPAAYGEGPRLPIDPLIPIGNPSQNKYCCSQKSFLEQHRYDKRGDLNTYIKNCLESAKKRIEGRMDDQYDLSCFSQLFLGCTTQGLEQQQYCGAAYTLLLNTLAYIDDKVPGAANLYFVSEYNPGSASGSARAQTVQGTTRLIVPALGLDLNIAPIPVCKVHGMNCANIESDSFVDRSQDNGKLEVKWQRDGDQEYPIVGSGFWSGNHYFVGVGYGAGFHPRTPTTLTRCLCLQYTNEIDWDLHLCPGGAVSDAARVALSPPLAAACGIKNALGLLTH